MRKTSNTVRKQWTQTKKHLHSQKDAQHIPKNTYTEKNTPTHERLRLSHEQLQTTQMKKWATHKQLIFKHEQIQRTHEQLFRKHKKTFKRMSKKFEHMSKYWQRSYFSGFAKQQKTDANRKNSFANANTRNTQKKTLTHRTLEIKICDLWNKIYNKRKLVFNSDINPNHQITKSLH